MKAARHRLLLNALMVSLVTMATLIGYIWVFLVPFSYGPTTPFHTVSVSLLAGICYRSIQETYRRFHDK